MKKEKIEIVITNNQPWKSPTRRYWNRKPFTMVKKSKKIYNRKREKSEFKKMIERALAEYE